MFDLQLTFIGRWFFSLLDSAARFKRPRKPMVVSPLFPKVSGSWRFAPEELTP
jgi:hypothetical protein